MEIERERMSSSQNERNLGLGREGRGVLQNEQGETRGRGGGQNSGIWSKRTFWMSPKVDSILMSHMQKSREALADARKSIRKRIENKQWTYCSSFMSKTWFYTLVPFSWSFCFLIRNFISFCSPFYYCNWPKNSQHHAYSRHDAN